MPAKPAAVACAAPPLLVDVGDSVVAAAELALFVPVEDLVVVSVVAVPPDLDDVDWAEVSAYNHGI